MSVLFFCAGDHQGRMLEELRARLPRHSIAAWPDVPDPGTIEHAVVWMPPESFFDGLSNLRHVHAIAAGVDQLLRHPGLPEPVEVYRLEDAGMGVKMSEYVLYGVLHAHRRFPQLQQAQRQGRWAREIRTPSARRWRVGIMGAGVLGRQVASRLVLNGYPVQCWSRTTRQLPDGVNGYAGPEALDDFLTESNVLVCLLPLTDQTRGILNAALFARLPEGAFLINPGRGEHLVEADLTKALDAGQLCGALLDVFVEEPLPEAHAFWRDPRILITPHLAAPSPIRESMSRIAATVEALDTARGSASTASSAGTQGEPVLAPDLQTARVDRERGY